MQPAKQFNPLTTLSQSEVLNLGTSRSRNENRACPYFLLAQQANIRDVAERFIPHRDFVGKSSDFVIQREHQIFLAQT